MLDPGLLPPLNATDDPLSAAVRAISFGALLEAGRPVATARLGTPAGTGGAAVRRAVDALVTAGRMTVEENTGAVTGSLGLSVTPTRHALDLPQGRRYTWCALDAVGIFGALRASGRITSTTADGAAVVLELADGEPVGDRELAVFLPRRRSGPTVRSWCPLVNFHPSVDRAEAWSAGNDVPGTALDLAEVSRLGTRLWRDAIDAATRLGPWTTDQPLFR